LSRKTIELLLNVMFEKDQDTILIALLKTLKEQYSVEELEEEFFLELQKISSHIQEKKVKAAYIEVMVELPYFNYEYDVLDEYLTLVSENETSEDDAVRCLSAFITMNMYKKDIFVRLSQFTDKQRAIRILVKLGDIDWGIISNEFQSFAEEVRHALRVSNRIFVITQFLFFVHPSYGAFSNILNLAVHYPTIESAINDWAWRTPNSTENLINAKIVSPQEAKIFVKLGKLMYEQVQLTPSDKVLLYSAFFKNKDPIDVILNLPV
jgi:hypothetical protein